MRSSNVVYASCKSLFISIAGIKGRQERYCLSGGHKLALFEQTVLPHMDAAGNFSSLLMRNEHGAEGMVQEVDFRALKFLTLSMGRWSRLIAHHYLASAKPRIQAPPPKPEASLLIFQCPAVTSFTPV